MLAATLAAANGLVLTADFNSNFLAFDGSSGRVLPTNATHEPVGGGIIAYKNGGQERSP